jgi:hypothetical protein
MRLIGRTATALLTTAIVLGGTATASTAQSTTIKDKTSDVLTYADQTTDKRGVQLGYSESVASGTDLRSMRVKHTKKSVSVKITFSELAADTTVYVSLRLNGRSRLTHVLANTYDDTGVIINAQGRKQCSVPLKTHVGTGGSINAVIKRSCLGDPKKIKAAAFTVDQGFFGDNTPYTGDVLSSRGVRDEQWTKWLKAS